MPNQTTQKQTRQLYAIACPPDCGFLIRSHDRVELLPIAKQHAKTCHSLDCTDADLEGMMFKVTL